VYLNIPGPHGIVQPDPGIEKIRTCIPVIHSGMNDCNEIPITVKELILKIKTVFPQVMQEFLFHI
jgi:hypothetical protein